MAFLYCASGDAFQRHAGKYIGISQSALSQTIDECLDVFYKVMVPVYNVLPTEEEAREEAEEVWFRSGFPAIVWGIIDGTHIVVSVFDPESCEQDTFTSSIFL